MSYIRFQDEHGAANVRGTERPRLLGLAHDVVTGAVLSTRTRDATAAELHDLLPADHYLRGAASGRRLNEQWLTAYGMALCDIFDEPIVEYRGHRIGTVELALNSALILGSDAVKLGVRLHAQCEINCWVAAAHRGWLADIIAGAVDAGIYRAGVGWEDVEALMRSAADSPVVASFGGSFPVPESDYWETRPAAELWRHGMDALYARPEDRLELRPEDWSTYRLSTGLSVLDLFAFAEGQPWRLDRALGLEPWNVGAEGAA